MNYLKLYAFAMSLINIRYVRLMLCVQWNKYDISRKEKFNLYQKESEIFVFVKISLKFERQNKNNLIGIFKCVVLHGNLMKLN